MIDRYDAQEALENLVLRDGSMMQLNVNPLRHFFLISLVCSFVLAFTPMGVCQSTGGTRGTRTQDSRAKTTQGTKTKSQQQAPARQPRNNTKQPVARQADQRSANAKPTNSKAAADAEQAIDSIPHEPRMPEWMPLTQEHQDYINQILSFWEAKSSRIKRYHCDFTRWKYDLGFNKAGEIIQDVRGKEAASEIVKGHIEFEAPDKALLQVTEGWRFVPKDEDYREATMEETAEHWVCNGKSFFEYNYREKTLRKFPLPPEAQGEAIARGPLPFLFKAKANDISNRFWLRIVTPKDETEAYHLEATPKSREDAAEFSRVVIILDSEEFLPKALAIFPPEPFRVLNSPPPPANPTRELYVFDKRKVNPILDELRDVIPIPKSDPKPPKGWKLVEEKTAEADAE